MYGKTPKKILRLGIDLTIQDWFETCSNRSNECLKDFKKKECKSYIMQLFSADTTMFLNVFWPKKVEKMPSIVAQKHSIFFSPIAAQTAQTEEFIFQNVAYRATVYRTGTVSFEI